MKAVGRKGQRGRDFRVGIGYDIHQLVNTRRLILGGVHVPFERGLAGHSDADCLTHAVVDAVLGAVGQGDIGRQFGVRRPSTRGVSSVLLLRHTIRRVMKAGWRVNNVDATVVCEAPRLGPHVPAMRARLARTLRVEPGRVNLKATTSKGLGPVGEAQAIAAFAVASVVRP